MSVSNMDFLSVLDTEAGFIKSKGGETPTCKIWFETQETGRLISPCRCIGSMGYVHETWLKIWIEEQESANRPNCEICQYTYNIEIIGFWLILVFLN